MPPAEALRLRDGRGAACVCRFRRGERGRLPSRLPSTQAEPSRHGSWRPGRSYSGALHLDARTRVCSTVCGSTADGMGARASGGRRTRGRRTPSSASGLSCSPGAIHGIVGRLAREVICYGVLRSHATGSGPARSGRGESGGRRLQSRGRLRSLHRSSWFEGGFLPGRESSDDQEEFCQLLAREVSASASFTGCGTAVRRAGTAWPRVLVAWTRNRCSSS